MAEALLCAALHGWFLWWRDHVLRLAMRAIECAAGGLHDTFYFAGAVGTGLAGAVVNLETLVVEFCVSRGASKIEKPITRASAGIIQGQGAASFDGFGKNLTNRAAKPFDLSLVKPIRRALRRNGGAKQGLAGVNVAEAGDD